MLAKEIKVNSEFDFNGKKLKRITFEGKEFVLYRCIENIVAIDKNSETVYFIDKNTKFDCTM